MRDLPVLPTTAVPHEPAPATVAGRGAAHNPANRFEERELIPSAEWTDPDDPGPRTRFYRDASRAILARNQSPDIGFDVSINPYRGCEHGCVYCYARPTHEYLGYSAGLDFESRIMVKEDAAALLRAELMSPRWEPQVIAISGVTDPYQPVEHRLEITRRCLQVLAEFRNPVAIITKNHLVTRDVDVLAALAEHGAAAVAVSVTSLRREIQKLMEPRTSTPVKRLDAIRTLSRAGIPVRVMVGPVVPGLTDHELPAIIEAAAEAGAVGAGYIMLRLPHGVKDLFEDWLTRHFPDRKDKVLNRMREMRQGKLYDAAWGTRMRGEGVFADQVRALYNAACRKFGFDRGRPSLRVDAFRRPDTTGQLGLFD